MSNEIIKANEGGALAIAANKIANIYLSDVANLNAAVGVPMTDEAKRCGVNALLSLCGDMGASEVQKLPREQLVQVIQFVTINGLDIFSGQVFIDKRWDSEKKTYSVKATPMGSAYEVMVKRFGVDVKTVHPAWIIHEGDDFTLPQFDGLKIIPATFKPTLKGISGKAIAVCYPIEKTNGDAEYVVSTREEVARNLMAQILNAALRNKSANRADLMKKMEGKTLEDLLADEYLAQFISPAYRSPASRESMIIAKMKKNALLHYTRDLGNKAYATVANAVESDNSNDMISKNVVASVDNNEPAAKGEKVNDFTVDDPEALPAEKEPETSASEEPVVETKAPEANENGEIKEEVKPASEPVNPEVVSVKPKDESGDGEPSTIDFFNSEDL